MRPRNGKRERSRDRRTLRLSPLTALVLSLCAAPLAASETAEEGDPATHAIRVYQEHLSSMRHFRCRFAPSCSQFAADAVATYGLVEGSARAADRLMRCSRSAEKRYSRNSQGLLVDPVGGVQESLPAARTPAWLLPAPSRVELPTTAGLEPDRRARLDETLRFAQDLEQRGDCERASTEFQRAGTLADTLPAHAWAFERVGACYYRSSDWIPADRAFLISAMLATDADSRATAGFGAAVSRFDAGAHVACLLLLDDPALTRAALGPWTRPSVPGSPDSSRTTAPALTASHVTTLAGMCALAIGEWAAADSMFKAAATQTDSDRMRARIERLGARVAEGPELPRRSPGTAGVLSALVPGAGQSYGGHTQDGIRHLLFNAALIYTVAALATHDQVPAAVIVGSIALPFYVGNILGAQDAARRFNRTKRLGLLERAIEDSSR